ncbi:hypothetical protein HPB51_016760 [Rhipicephalus microplus]|uniref:FAD dependent oxidoreductase domain-containing protein n=1 Tax=Rhipicephalus microplus TaxID=6941 RepID=A0A9J6DB26_RHIMP|nr:hypothetical protein HPB51_016760 [Rhipicephalus microplus]
MSGNRELQVRSPRLPLRLLDLCRPKQHGCLTSSQLVDAAQAAENTAIPLELPGEARVIICGGGVVGCSVAYHLARDHGLTDVVVLEKGV